MAIISLYILVCVVAVQYTMNLLSDDKISFILFYRHAQTLKLGRMV